MCLYSTYLCIRIWFIYEIFAQKCSPINSIWLYMEINISLWYSICYYFSSICTYEPQPRSESHLDPRIKASFVLGTDSTYAQRVAEAFSLNTETGQMSVKGWVLAPSTDQPIEQCWGKCSSCGSEAQSPCNPFPILPLPSVVAPPKWEAWDDCDFLDALGRNKSPTQGHRKGCNNCTPRAVILLLIKMERQSNWLSRLNNKDNLMRAMFLWDFVHQQVPAGSSGSWSPQSSL